MKPSHRWIPAIGLALAAGTMLSSGVLGAHAAPHEEHGSAPLPERILGRHSWPITTASPTAQAYFDQGLQLIHRVLEGVLARDIGHPGACHAYVHATETTPKVTEAQRCADLLGASIPGVSHINHMPSHTYNRVGRWGDATRANVQAWHSDLRAARGDGSGVGIYASGSLYARSTRQRPAATLRVHRDQP